MINYLIGEAFSSSQNINVNITNLIEMFPVRSTYNGILIQNITLLTEWKANKEFLLKSL